MKKNIEKLAELGELRLRTEVRNSLGKIENAIYNLLNPKEKEHFVKAYKDLLKCGNKVYHDKTGSFKEAYGVEFPDLQKQYEEMLPQINKYLGIKSERTPEQTQALSNLSVKTQYGSDITGDIN